MQSSSLVMEHYSKFIWPTDTTATVSPVSGDVNPKATEPGDISESLIPITSHEITSIISKPESKKMLKELCNCNDLLAARKLAAPILKRHMHSDQGLYPIAAAKAISRLPGGFMDAMNILILVTFRTVLHLDRQSDAMWKSLRKGAGAASRAFKVLDSNLSLIVAEHWLSVIKRGAEIEWDPLPIVDEIVAIWDCLLLRIPPPPAKPKGSKHGMPHLLQPGKPQIFKLCRHVLLHAHQRRVATIKASTVAGPHLPKELVGMIADAMYDSAPSLQILRSLKSPDFENFIPNGMRPIKRFIPKDKSTHDPQSREVWGVFFTLRKVKA